VQFFASNFEKFSEVVSTLPNDSSHVDKLKTLFERKKSLASDLAFINAHLSFLPPAITKLETRGLPLSKQLKILENVRSTLLLYRVHVV
jgi:hypothetical protein